MEVAATGRVHRGGHLALQALLVDVLRNPPVAIWIPVTVVVMLVNYYGCKHWAFAAPALGSQPR